MQYYPKNRHECKLGIDVNKSCFAPLHPERFSIDVVLRRLRKVIILDVNDKKCKHFFSNNKSMRHEFKRHINSPHRYIIHPFSKANGLMEVLFLLLILFRYTLLGIKYGDAFVTMELIADVLWFIFMLSIFFTGYVKYKTKEVFIHPREIACQYLTTYFFFDLVLLLKTPLRLCSSSLTFHFIIVSLTVLSTIVRFRTVLFYLDNILMYIGAKKLTSFLIYEILKLVYFLHFITCVFILVPERIHPDNPYSWLYGLHAKNPTRFEIYCHDFLVVVCYFFGADYDFEPTDPIQNLLLFLLSFVGRLYTLVLIAKVLGEFGITNISDSKYEQHLTVLTTYLRSLQLPHELRHRIITGFQNKSRKQHFDEREIQSHLTDHLKTELFLYGARSLIERHAILRKIPRTDLFAFLSIMESKMFFSNDVIVQPGDRFDYAYFISSGTVAGFESNGKEWVHLKEGDEFGIAWIAFDNVEVSRVTWMAIETTEVYCVKREDLIRYFSSQHDVARYFVAKVREKFGKLISDRGVVKRDEKDVLSSLREGEVLETQRLRLFHMD